MLAPSVQQMAEKTLLHPATHMGAVQLTVAKLDRAIAFYTAVLGFQLHDRSDGQANLGAGGANLVELVELPNACQVDHHSGLYHFALLTPSRFALAQVLRNLVQHGIRIGGSDHLVSEALYLSDPDGNGIEVYHDRPRDQWHYDEAGRPVLGGLPLDYRGILRELDAGDASWQGLDEATVMGHMHLHVNNLPAAVNFYQTIVGFDLIMDWNQASFLSAGGYHHHLGVNTWAGVGAPPQPADAVGLRHYVIKLAEPAERTRLIARLDGGNIGYDLRTDALFVRDPAQNGILFVTDTNH